MILVNTLPSFTTKNSLTKENEVIYLNLNVCLSLLMMLVLSPSELGLEVLTEK